MKLRAPRGAREWALWGAAGLGAVALGGALFGGRRGALLVLYDSNDRDTATFRDAASVAAALLSHRGRVDIVRVGSLSDMRRAWQSEERINRLILVGHGGPRRMIDFHVGRVGAIAAELAPRLTRGAIIGLAGCAAGSNVGENEWSVASYGPGGHMSLAGLLRDALTTRGALSGVEVRAHAARGATLDNPAARTFKVGARYVGQPGESVLDQQWGRGAHRAGLHADWADDRNVPNIRRWMVGEKIRVPRPT